MKENLLVIRWTHFLVLCLCAVSVASGAQRFEAEESLDDTVRFLKQATFGPAPQLITRVRKIGFTAFLDEQFAAPMTDYPELPLWPQGRPPSCTGECPRDNYTMYQLQSHFFRNALYGQDQLRQRVAFALSQILVTSAADVPLPSWMRPYQQLLYRSAFGNFRQLLYDVTLNPAMGRYLDMVNNRCQNRIPPDPNVCRSGLATKPNENYAREILQLFSIGVFTLNRDGTLQLDGEGSPIPSYDQETIEEFSRVFTGWILAPALPGPPEVGGTVPNYRDPMRVRVDAQGREDYHDKGSKRLLNGFELPGRQSAEEELNAAIDNIINHPNVAPFMSKRLIQKLVTSNPSPEYVGRVSAVFTANRESPRQLQAVVEAILLDPEARGDVKADPSYGKLREPVLFIANLLRAFHATSDGVLNSLNVGGSLIGSAEMGQDVFNAPTVFNFYQPDYEVPDEDGLLGPEFGILSSITALRRANFIHRVVMNPAGIPPVPPDRPTGTQIHLSLFSDLAGSPEQLVWVLNTLLMRGAMSEAMRQIVTNAVSSIPGSQPLLRVQTAVYLIATSSQYQVER